MKFYVIETQSVTKREQWRMLVEADSREQALARAAADEYVVESVGLGPIPDDEPAFGDAEYEIDDDQAPAQEPTTAADADPDLLAASKAALEYLEANRPTDVRKHFHQMNQHENGVCKPLRAAIAKAESL